MTKSLTQQAIELVDQGMKPLQAAKQVGLAHNTLYVALKKKRMEAEGRCACCGQLLPK